MEKKKATRQLILGGIAIGLGITACFVYGRNEKWGTEEVQKETLSGVRPQGSCSMSGRVISAATGKPIEHARMYLHYNVTHGSIFIDTARNGTFAFRNIPKGPFSLQMSRTDGYQDVAYNPENRPGQYPDFSLNDGEQRSAIELKALPACRISGKIVDENGKKPNDIADWNVYAWVKDDQGNGWRCEIGSVSRSDGVYVIDGLGKPAYVMATNERAAKEGNAIPPVYAPGVFSRSEATFIDFEGRQNVDGVDITLKKDGGFCLEGTVRDEAGHPVPEAFVVVHHCDMLFDRVTTYSDAQGRYKIQGLGDGEVLVHVDAIHRGFVRTHTSIVIEKKTAKKRRDFVLHRGVSISGKFVDEDEKEWQIGNSFGDAKVSEDSTEPKEEPCWSGLPNKYSAQAVDGHLFVSYNAGEGDYDRSEIVFPTKSTFVFQSLKPGYTFIEFLPQKEGQKVIKILYNGQDVKDSGIETKPGEEVKDVTIVIGKQ